MRIHSTEVLGVGLKLIKITARKYNFGEVGLKEQAGVRFDVGKLQNALVDLVRYYLRAGYVFLCYYIGLNPQGLVSLIPTGPLACSHSPY